MTAAVLTPVATTARSPLVGTVLTIAGAVAAELVAEPFDVVWIDLEHGALGPAEAQEMILGAQAAGALALVRIGHANSAALLGPMLDAGADGIVGADVRRVEQAAQLVSLMQYPPAGTRGYGPRRATLRRRTLSRQQTPPRLWLQIESQEGVAVASRIARLPGIDALIVGIADLCIDLGIPVGLSDRRLHDALTAISSAADRAGVRFGLAGPLLPLAALADRSDAATVLMHSTDARLCAEAVDRVAQQLRDGGNRPREERNAR